MSLATSIEILTPDFLRKRGALETSRCGETRRIQSQSGNSAVKISGGAHGFRCALL